MANASQKTLSLQRKERALGPALISTWRVEFSDYTVAGYTLMTQMAEAAIDTLGQTPGGGYLQNCAAPRPSTNQRKQRTSGDCIPVHSVRLL